MLQKITFSQVKDNLVNINRRDVCTRAHDATLLDVPRPKSELFQKSNCYNGPVLWNNLPVYIRSLHEINRFKQEIKKYFIRMFLNDKKRDYILVMSNIYAGSVNQ